MSTGFPVFNAHRNPSTAPAELVVKIVERETDTVADDRIRSIALSGCSSSNGMMNDMTLESVADFELHRRWLELRK